MPRQPRVFQEGGTYHVYNRFARGAENFGNDSEAEEFLALLYHVRERDDLVVYAWCLLPDSYHLLVRTTSRPLWRSMATIQVRYTKGLNRRLGVTGPAWQARYRAQLIEDQRFFDHLVAYVHLRPVAAELVEDSAEWSWGGHYEIANRTRNPLIDVDELWSAFGDDRRIARRRYLEALKAGEDRPWLGQVPGHLPWWRFANASSVAEIELNDTLPIANRAKRTVPGRPTVDAATVVAAACCLSGIGRSRLAGRLKDRLTVRTRRAVALVACDGFGVPIKGLAEELGRRPDGVSDWLRSGAEKRGDDDELDHFATALDDLLREGSIIEPD